MWVEPFGVCLGVGSDFSGVCGMMFCMFNNLITPLIQLSSDVGEEILSYYKNSVIIELKIDKTPLTTADKNAHQSIVNELSKLTPEVPILSEESDAPTFEQRSKWNEYWLIDPLDGTKDFIKQTGDFCICIAYIKNHIPIFGLIYTPLMRTHYYGFDGVAYKYQNGIHKRINACVAEQPIRVVTGHYSEHNPQLQAHLAKLGEYQYNHLGSALKFCEIAQGNYDYYPRFGPCSEWDTAAGVCILQSAGGRVVDENGETLKYNMQESLLSPVFFASGKS